MHFYHTLVVSWNLYIMRLSIMFCTTLIIMLFSFAAPDKKPSLLLKSLKNQVSCYHSEGLTVDGLYAMNCWFRNCRLPCWWLDSVVMAESALLSWNTFVLLTLGKPCRFKFVLRNSWINATLLRMPILGWWFPMPVLLFFFAWMCVQISVKKKRTK